MLGAVTRCTGDNAPVDGSICRTAISLLSAIETYTNVPPVVTVHLLGTCESCPISPVTLKHGVERILRERVPGITEVVAIEA